jgi:hypothetical protein
MKVEASAGKKAMNPAILQIPFVQTALPVMFTILIAVWVNNKALDGIHRRLDDIIKRLERIEIKLVSYKTIW